MMNFRNPGVKSAVYLIFLMLVLLNLTGCTSGKFLLDQPVSDPIMMVDDNQSSDLARCEEGGVAGGSGSCPT